MTPDVPAMVKKASWNPGNSLEDKEDRRESLGLPRTPTPVGRETTRGQSSCDEESDNEKRELSPEDYEEQHKNELLKPESTK